MTKEIKQIRFRGKIAGNGIVNYDGDQKWLIKNMNFDNLIIPTKKDGQMVDSVKYAKKHIFIDENGNLDYKIKISSDCLRNAIFNDVEHVNPAISNVPLLFCNFVTSKVGILRGYTFGMRDDDIDGFSGYVRKSPLEITSAIQISDKNKNLSKSYIELCSPAGQRTDTSLFYKENIGDIKYAFEGSVNLKTLQFISTDPVFGRMSIDNEYVVSGQLQDNLRNHYGDSATFKTGYFTNRSVVANIGTSYCESGIVLGKDIQKELLKYLFKHIFGINIGRAGAFAKVVKVEFAFIYDAMSPENSLEWKDASLFDDIIDNESLHQFYVESTEDDFNKRDAFIAEYKEIMNKRKENKKKAKEAKKKAKDDKKKSEADS